MVRLTGAITGADTWRMEQFSKAYVTAVASAAECTVSNVEVDIDSLDITLRRRTVGTTVRSPQLDVQLKTTSSDCVGDTSVSFVLDRRTYDSLRDSARAVPCILIVVHMPDLIENWTSHSEDQLQLRRCGYWVSLVGLPDLPAGQQSKTITIPRSAVFDVAACDSIFTKLANREPL